MITIFTPTYNRKEKIKVLYRSLEEQTNKDFIWLVVDDGSTDNTQELFEKWKKEASFKIIYIYQKNQGKHIAYNTALANMTTEYHVVVDSDDWLDKKAVEIFYRKLVVLPKEAIGLVFKKNVVGLEKWLVESRVTIPDIKLKYNLAIETCIVIKNNFIGNFRFKKFEKENFMPEDPLYIYLAKKGKFLVCFEGVYYFKYLDDGLTKNVFFLWRKNPNGTLYALNIRKEYILSNLNGIKKYIELLKVSLNIEMVLSFVDEDYFSNKKKILILPIVKILRKRRFGGE